MVLEALTAVGLVSNVIQFVQFGYSTSHADLEAIAKDLEKHTQALTTASASNDKSLEALAQRASSAAKELVSAIDGIRNIGVNHGKNKHPRWASFRQALEIIWKKDKITVLQSRLESLRDQLQHHFITEIRDSSDAIRKSVVEIQTNDGLRNTIISESLKNITRTLHTISSHISSSASWNSVSELQKAIDICFRLETLADNYKHHQILRSLQFPSMDVRYSSIAEAHKRTFEWIFKTESLPAKDPRSSIDLSSWLRKGTGIYWVTGKPGSGKSTLMKFLDDHQTTSMLLRQWSQPLGLVTASFYFWNAGTYMQKSLEGLLQSLLHKILSTCPELIQVVCPERCASTRTPAEASPTWSLSKLQNTFELLKSQHNISTRFYFHIDGLDEYEGDHYKVIDIIEDLAQMPNFKICVSSRPWNQFQHIIGNSNRGSLHLHQLTKHDIKLFARESISVHRGHARESFQDKHYQEFIQEISQRAQGVFLWVRLVVRSLRDGLVNGDPVSLLRKRLEEIPTDLEEFFDLIIKSVDSVYSERMARTFLVALASPKPLQIIHYSFLDEEDIYFGWAPTFSAMAQDEISQRISETRRRLNGRYKGLLEPASDSDSRYVTVDFLHRTLRDFLMTTRMRKFLEARAPLKFDPLNAAIGALFAKAKFLNQKLHPTDFIDTLNFAQWVAEETWDSSYEYRVIDHIDTIHQWIWPMKATMCDGQPELMLRAAVHYQEDDYVRHRIESSSLPLNLDWILLHLTSCYRPVRSFDIILKLPGRKLHECLCHDINALAVKKPNIDLIKLLLEKGANPNANVNGVVDIWPRFLAALQANLGGQYADSYWEVLKLLVLHGAIVNRNPEVWTHMALRAGSLDNTSLDHLLKGYCFFLEHGLNPGTKICIDILSALFYDYELIRRQTIQVSLRNLISSSLRHGVDITRMIVRTNPDTLNAKSSWFGQFLNDLSSGNAWHCDLKADSFFKIFLQYGLDPNHGLNDSTVWEHLLEAIEIGLHRNLCFDQEFAQSMIALFLRHRAGPHSSRLHQMLGWRTGYQCLFKEPQASQVKDAVRREIEDLKSRDKLLQQSRSGHAQVNM